MFEVKKKKVNGERESKRVEFFRAIFSTKAIAFHVQNKPGPISVRAKNHFLAPGKRSGRRCTPGDREAPILSAGQFFWLRFGPREVAKAEPEETCEMCADRFPSCNFNAGFLAKISQACAMRHLKGTVDRDIQVRNISFMKLRYEAFINFL